MASGVFWIAPANTFPSLLSTMLPRVALPEAGRGEKARSATECDTIVSLREPDIVTGQWGRQGLVICIIALGTLVQGSPSLSVWAHHGNVARPISSEENKPLRNRNSSYNT